jgi:hypothetical protein
VPLRQQGDSIPGRAGWRPLPTCSRCGELLRNDLPMNKTYCVACDVPALRPKNGVYYVCPTGCVPPKSPDPNHVLRRATPGHCPYCGEDCE